MVSNNLRVLRVEKTFRTPGIVPRSNRAGDAWALEQIYAATRASLAQISSACCLEVELANFSLLQTDEPDRRPVLDQTELTGPFILFSCQADKIGADRCLSVAAKD